MTIRPPRLRKGDTIGIVAPSSPAGPDQDERWNEGVRCLAELGFRVKAAPNARRAAWS